LLKNHHIFPGVRRRGGEEERRRGAITHYPLPLIFASEASSSLS